MGASRVIWPLGLLACLLHPLLGLVWLLLGQEKERERERERERNKGKRGRVDEKEKKTKKGKKETLIWR